MGLEPITVCVASLLGLEPSTRNLGVYLDTGRLHKDSNLEEVYVDALTPSRDPDLEEGFI